MNEACSFTETIGLGSVFSNFETPSPTMSFSRGDLIRSLPTLRIRGDRDSRWRVNDHGRSVLKSVSEGARLFHTRLGVIYGKKVIATLINSMILEDEQTRILVEVVR